VDEFLRAFWLRAAGRRGRGRRRHVVRFRCCFEGFAFERYIGIDQGSEFGVLENRGIFAGSQRQDGFGRSIRRAGDFVKAVQRRLFVVGKPNGSDVESEAAAAAEALLWFDGVNDAGCLGTFGDYDDAIEKHVRNYFEIDGIAGVGGGRSHRLEEFQSNLRAFPENERRVGRTGRRVWTSIVGDSFARGSSGRRKASAGDVFENDDRSQGNVTDFALGGAQGVIGFVAAGDLNDLAALKRGANIKRGHGAVEINVAVAAGAFDASSVLGVCERGEKEK